MSNMGFLGIGLHKGKSMPAKTNKNTYQVTT